MYFNENRVQTPFSKDNWRWVGWIGYFSDDAQTLKDYVEQEDDVHLRRLEPISRSYSCPYHYFYNGVEYGRMFFYPVISPERTKLKKSISDVSRKLRKLTEVLSEISDEWTEL